MLSWGACWALFLNKFWKILELDLLSLSLRRTATSNTCRTAQFLQKALGWPFLRARLPLHYLNLLDPWYPHKSNPMMPSQSADDVKSTSVLKSLLELSRHKYGQSVTKTPKTPHYLPRNALNEKETHEICIYDDEPLSQQNMCYASSS